MFYMDNDYSGISKLLEEHKIKKVELSESKVILKLESGAKVFIEYVEYDGLNIKAVSD